MANTTPAQQQYPNLNPYGNANANGNGNGSLSNAKDTVVNTASSTAESIKNSNTVQTLANGPMAEKARTEATATKNEFSNLAASRTTPSTQTANGQDLTHYHSFFYDLLSWQNPRATAISYAVIVLFVIVGRYVPLARYLLKALYIVLGITAVTEAAGKLILGQGIASNMRPRRYYTIPRETLESVMEDAVELVNFFVIEFQRIVFAENVAVTFGAFATALMTYFLIKVTPAWGLALIFTTLAYFLPFIYIQNRELIDGQLNNATEIISKQTQQVRELAAEHTNKAVEVSKSSLKEYSGKAQEMIGGAKKAAVEKGVVSPETAGVKKEDFPAAPTSQPTHEGFDGTGETSVTNQEQEPLLA